MNGTISDKYAAMGIAIILLGFGTTPNVAWGAASYNVNCGTGQKLAHVLATAPEGSSINVSGVCQERISIATDGITIDGNGTAVIEREGAGPIPTNFDPLVAIDGASGVSLIGLTVQNGPGEGILAANGASFTLKNVTSQNNGFSGISVSANSTADFEDVTSQGNLLGMDAFNDAVVILRGDIDLTGNIVGMDVSASASIELRPAQLNASNNAAVGVGISSSSSVHVFAFLPSQGSTITANGNGECGIIVGNNGGLVLSSPPPFLGTDINVVMVRNNGACGIELSQGGVINVGAGHTAQFLVENNPVGLIFGDNSGAGVAGGMQVRYNGIGVLADGAGSIRFESIEPNPSFITDNTDADVDLRWGSRLTLCDVTVGSAPLTDASSMYRTITAPCQP